MAVFRHELRQGRTSLAVWTACIGALLCACLLLFPEMKGQMAAAGDMFASMGGFSAAFGMDRLDIGTLTGFYSVECGNILGLCGAFYACLTGISSLAKEERGHTAELLLTHPVSRARVAAEKLASVLAQITAMNAILICLAMWTIWLIGERIPWDRLLLLHGAYYLLQLELGCVCFGISAFLRRGGAGLGLGLAAMAYFLNLLANMAERAGALRYITPFAYCEGADILTAGHLDMALLLPGMAYAAAGVAAALLRYTAKDIQ